MDRATAKRLCALNTRFYAANAASFSQTRNAPWNGWRRCLVACGLGESDEAICSQPAKGQLANQASGVQPSNDQAATRHPSDRQPLVRSVLDVACGNLRFEAFLEREYPAIDWRLFAIDNCEPLVDASDAALAKKVNFTCEDIIGNMLEDLPAIEPANAPATETAPALARSIPFDLVVSFGFMHHIPGFDLRVRFLKEALGYVKPGGHLLVSFWQFLNDEAKRARIEQTHAEALEHFSGELAEELLLHQAESPDEANHPGGNEEREHLVFRPDDLEAGDYLLGWKNRPGQYRYCHHFSDEEIDQLVASLVPYATLVESFSADGKTGNLNRYVVLRRD